MFYQLPVVWKDCRPLVGKEVYGELCCVALSPRQPFLLHLATPTHLIVTDIRQPLEPHLYEPHLLESLPCSLAIIVTCNFSILRFLLQCSSGSHQSHTMFLWQSSIPHHVLVAVINPIPCSSGSPQSHTMFLWQSSIPYHVPVAVLNPIPCSCGSHQYHTMFQWQSSIPHHVPVAVISPIPCSSSSH